MRLLTLLFTLLFWFNAVAVAPYGIKGQSQSGTLYSNVHQFPNNQVTNMGGINALVETGNKNILINPSFEHSTFSTGWTSGAGSFSQNLTVEIDGLKAAEVTLSAQALAVTQDSTLYAAQFADGVQGLASVRVKTSLSGIKVCSRQAGVTSTTNCVNVQGNGKWGLYKVPMILGATSNGISIHSNGTSLTGTVYLDDAFVGAVDLQATVDASKIAGKSYFAAGSSVANTGYVAYSGTPAPTVEYSALGTWATTSSGGYKQTISNLPAGCYKHEWYAQVGGSNIGGVYKICASVNGVCSNSSQAGETQPSTAYFPMIANDITCFNSSQSSVDFALLGAASVGSQSTLNTPVTFKLTYYNSGNTYSSTNADTDWASCGLTGAAFTGFGSSVPTPSLQCKRQGGDLLMKGTFTAGTTPTSVEARLALPTWNGVQLVSAGSSVIPSLQLSGDLVRNSNSTTYFRNSVLIEPSVSYMTFGAQFTTLNALTKQTGANIVASGELASLTARIPIEGWQQSNIIIGQFNGLESCLSTLDCTDVFSAKISAAGVVSAENVDWINGNCTMANPVNTCQFKAGIFTVSPNCVVVHDGADLGNLMAKIDNSQTSSTQVGYRTQLSAANTYQALAVNLICQKQGVDYIGKTAKAVASDQNLRSVGLTRAVVNSCLWTSAGAFNNPTMCGAGFSSMSKPATGRYQLNFARTQLNDPVCVANNTNVGADRMCNIFSLSTTSVVVQCENSSAGTDLDVPGLVICHGVE